MKRSIVLLLAAMMLMNCMACSSQPQANVPAAPPSTAPGAPASDPAPASGERVTIEYWHRNSETAGGPTIDSYAKAFNESQDKYTIKPVFMADAYKGIMQRLMAEAAAGKAPGVVQVGYYWLNFLEENYDFVDVNTLDNTYMSNYLPNIAALCTTTDGRVAGIPYSFSCPVMFYNAELLAKAGLDAANPPKTVTELYDWARKVKSVTGEYGLALAAASDFWLEQWGIESNGGRMVSYNADGSMTATFASPQGSEAMQMISDLINKDKAATYVTGEAINEAFTSGKVAMIGATIGWSGGITKGANFTVASGPMPVFGSNPPRVPVGGNFLTITAQTPAEQQGSWEWIQYLTTQKAYYEWSAATGYLPPRTDVQTMPEFQEYLKQNTLLGSAFEQMPNIVPFVAFPGDVGLEIEQNLLDARDTIMNGAEPAAKILTELQDNANKLMGK